MHSTDSADRTPRTSQREDAEGDAAERARLARPVTYNIADLRAARSQASSHAPLYPTQHAAVPGHGIKVTESSRIPPHVLGRLRITLATMGEISMRFEEARALEGRNGVRGHYVSDTWDHLGAEVARLNVVIATFRHHAGQNGLNADKVLFELGGVPKLPERVVLQDLEDPNGVHHGDMASDDPSLQVAAYDPTPEQVVAALDAAIETAKSEGNYSALSWLQPIRNGAWSVETKVLTPENVDDFTPTEFDELIERAR